MRYLLFLLVLIFAFCKNDTQLDQLVVNFPQTTLREAPGEKSREIKVLKKGEEVTELDKVSDFESVLMVGGQQLQSPWVKVQTADKQTGWVIASSMRPVPFVKMPDTTEYFNHWLEDKRLHCYFGIDFPGRIFLWSQNLGYAVDDERVASVYREALSLRKVMTETLANRAEPNKAGAKLDYFWLTDAMPCFVFQWVNNGSQPYLFTDYLYWLQIVPKTKGQQDDVFIETCLLAFPSDSIESFFPAWKFQLSDTEAASQLGTGIHLKMLRQIESALKTGPLFQPELMAFKEAVLDDILHHKSVYWQPRELILKELNQILAAGLTILDARDQAALQARRTMFENPEANGIKVNLRSG